MRKRNIDLTDPDVNRSIVFQLCYVFNALHKRKRGQVYLDFSYDEDDVSFHAKVRAWDIFLDKEPYRDGTACVYLSDHFYKEVDRIGEKLGVYIHWNNDGTIGWVSLTK